MYTMYAHGQTHNNNSNNVYMYTHLPQWQMKTCFFNESDYNSVWCPNTHTHTHTHRQKDRERERQRDKEMQAREKIEGEGANGRIGKTLVACMHTCVCVCTELVAWR